MQSQSSAVLRGPVGWLVCTPQRLRRLVLPHSHARHLSTGAPACDLSCGCGPHSLGAARERASLRATWELRGLSFHMVSGPCTLLVRAESQDDQGPSDRWGLRLTAPRAASPSSQLLWNHRQKAKTCLHGCGQRLTCNVAKSQSTSQRRDRTSAAKVCGRSPAVTCRAPAQPQTLRRDCRSYPQNTKE